MSKFNFPFISETKELSNLRKEVRKFISEALINNEFEELKEGLISAIKVLKDRGILAVISFHSAEDRIVKNFFKKDYKNFFEGINLKNVNKIKPSKEEKSTNPRSRSAILRIGEIEYVS